LYKNVKNDLSCSSFRSMYIFYKKYIEKKKNNDLKKNF